MSRELKELSGLRIQKDKIEEAYRQIFPKVDPFVVHDLYLRSKKTQHLRDTCIRLKYLQKKEQMRKHRKGI